MNGTCSPSSAGLTRDDNYATVGKPPCDWDDRDARETLVDALVGDANAVLAVCEGRELSGPLGEAAQLLAIVAGQDAEQGTDRMFRIARGVARDRVLSTVDIEARHGHKSRARTFDGGRHRQQLRPTTLCSSAGSEVCDTAAPLQHGTARRPLAYP